MNVGRFVMVQAREHPSTSRIVMMKPPDQTMLYGVFESELRPL